MDNGQPRSPDDDLLHTLVEALTTLRDAWTTISLALSDLLTDSASAQRDQTLAEVRSYLDAIQQNAKRDGDKQGPIPKHFHGDSQ